MKFNKNIFMVIALSLLFFQTKNEISSYCYSCANTDEQAIKNRITEEDNLNEMYQEIIEKILITYMPSEEENLSQEQQEQQFAAAFLKLPPYLLCINKIVLDKLTSMAKNQRNEYKKYVVEINQAQSFITNFIRYTAPQFSENHDKTILEQAKVKSNQHLKNVNTIFASSLLDIATKAIANKTGNVIGTLLNKTLLLDQEQKREIRKFINRYSLDANDSIDQANLREKQLQIRLHHMPVEEKEVLIRNLIAYWSNQPPSVFKSYMGFALPRKVSYLIKQIINSGSFFVSELALSIAPSLLQDVMPYAFINAQAFALKNILTRITTDVAYKLLEAKSGEEAKNLMQQVQHHIGNISSRPMPTSEEIAQNIIHGIRQYLAPAGKESEISEE